MKGKFKILATLLFWGVFAHAQKLPKVQTASMWAPSNIKIDGKATEWDNTFRAYNKAADIYYTISNDDKNLYFTLQAITPNVINAIVGYGFSFVVQKTDKKSDKNAISVNYPVYEKQNKRNPIKFAIKTGPTSDTTARMMKIVVDSYNKILDQKLKTIIVSGIPGMDTLSVYNESGIIAAGQFNIKKAYTIEMAIALTHLNVSTLDAAKLKYHIIIDGFKPPENALELSIPPGSSAEYIDAMRESMDHLNIQILKRYQHSDFWGEYTLAKKP